MNNLQFNDTFDDISFSTSGSCVPKVEKVFERTRNKNGNVLKLNEISVDDSAFLNDSFTFTETQKSSGKSFEEIIIEDGSPSHGGKQKMANKTLGMTVNSLNVQINKSMLKKNERKSRENCVTGKAVKNKNETRVGGSSKKSLFSNKENRQETKKSENFNLSAWGLPEKILSKYASRKITSMFPWQLECLSLPGVLNYKNLVYSAPTSAGKTLVAEILSIKTVLERRKKVLFILPFVSVVREKMFYFQDILSSSGVRVDGFMGSHNPPGGFKLIQVAICTIEKANSLINRLMQEGNLSDIGTVVVDEMHLLGDTGRGYLLELLLTKLRYMSLRSDLKIQVIGMSATLPNLPLLATWLDAELYTTEFRPIPLKEFCHVNSTIYDSELKLVRQLKPITELTLDSDNIFQLCLETINASCSVLIFCPTKSWCETLALQISEAFWKLGSSKCALGEELKLQLNTQLIIECLEQLKRCPVGLDEVLKKTVSFGVAYHHAGLTMDERDILESAFRDGCLRVLIATSTLSSGVNLPARRVIIRTPKFFGKPIDILTYKQMIGRAGRMGKDSAGESILICQQNDYPIAKDLMIAKLDPIESCLEGTGKLKRAILEIIASDVASSPDEIALFAKCTLLATNSDEITCPIDEAVDFLIKCEFIRLQTLENGQSKYVATPLAKACLSSSMPPEEGLALFTELEKARQCFVLETDLHLIYLVTPYNTCNQIGNIDWLLYLEIWEKLPTSMKRVGELVGVKVSYLINGTRGKIQSNTSKSYHKLQIHKRFYVSLILQDLVNEVSLNVVALKYNTNRGLLQSLQQSAATFAGMVTSFSKQLGWASVELLISQFQDRLQFGISRDLLDLMKLPALNGQRARALYDSGIETLSHLAAIDVCSLENILHKIKPFESGKEREGESEHDAKERNSIRTFWVTGKRGMTEREAAVMLINDAQQHLQLELGLVDAKWHKESVSDVFKTPNSSNVSVSSTHKYNLRSRSGSKSKKPHCSQNLIKSSPLNSTRASLNDSSDLNISSRNSSKSRYNLRSKSANTSNQSIFEDSFGIALHDISSLEVSAEITSPPKGKRIEKNSMKKDGQRASIEIEKPTTSSTLFDRSEKLAIVHEKTSTINEVSVNKTHGKSSLIEKRESSRINRQASIETNQNSARESLEKATTSNEKLLYPTKESKSSNKRNENGKLSDETNENIPLLNEIRSLPGEENGNLLVDKNEKRASVRINRQTIESVTINSNKNPLKCKPLSKNENAKTVNTRSMTVKTERLEVENTENSLPVNSLIQTKQKSSSPTNETKNSKCTSVRTKVKSIFGTNEKSPFNTKSSIKTNESLVSIKQGLTKSIIEIKRNSSPSSTKKSGLFVSKKIETNFSDTLIRNAFMESFNLSKRKSCAESSEKLSSEIKSPSVGLNKKLSNANENSEESVKMNIIKALNLNKSDVKVINEANDNSSLLVKNRERIESNLSDYDFGNDAIIEDAFMESFREMKRSSLSHETKGKMLNSLRKTNEESASMQMDGISKNTNQASKQDFLTDAESAIKPPVTNAVKSNLNEYNFGNDSLMEGAFMESFDEAKEKLHSKIINDEINVGRETNEKFVSNLKLKSIEKSALIKENANSEIEINAESTSKIKKDANQFQLENLSDCEDDEINIEDDFSESFVETKRNSLMETCKKAHADMKSSKMNCENDVLIENAFMDSFSFSKQNLSVERINEKKLYETNNKLVSMPDSVDCDIENDADIENAFMESFLETKRNSLIEIKEKWVGKKSEPTNAKQNAMGSKEKVRKGENLGSHQKLASETKENLASSKMQECTTEAELSGYDFGIDGIDVNFEKTKHKIQHSKATAIETIGSKISNELKVKSKTNEKFPINETSPINEQSIGETKSVLIKVSDSSSEISSPLKRKINSTRVLDEKPTKKQKLAFENEKLAFENIEIINVCDHRDLFESFKNELKQQTELSVSIACVKLNEKKFLIGNNILNNTAAGENQNFGFSFGERKAAGVAFFWGETHQTVYYVSLERTNGILSQEKIDLLTEVFSKRKTQVRIFDAKEQIKVLKLCCDINLVSKCFDPKIADWLLEPDGKEKNLLSLAILYFPDIVKLCKIAGISKGNGSIGLDLTSSINERIRASIESVVCWHVNEAIKLRLNYDLLEAYEIEMDCNSILTKMELDGFGIDLNELEDLSQNLKNYLSSIETKAFQIAGHRFSFTSSTEVAKVLGMYHGKKVSTSKQVLEQYDKPLSQLVLQWRKMNSTLTKMVYPLLRNSQNSRIYGCCITHNATGRISMHEPNVQNIPRDFEFRNPLTDEVVSISCRKVFKAPVKTVLLSADYCQLELRILAHLSQDRLLCGIMQSGEDVFRSISAKWNNICENEVTDSIRQQTKQICYGIIYGMGMKTLSEQLSIEEDEALSFTETFHQTYPGIKKFIKDTIEKCKQFGYVETLSGRKRFLPHINEINSTLKSQAERQAVNTTIQGSAADIAKKAMILVESKIQEKFHSSRNVPKLVLQLHDELLYEVSVKYVKVLAKILNKSMQEAINLSVPFPIRLKSGPSWGSMKEILI